MKRRKIGIYPILAVFMTVAGCILFGIEIYDCVKLPTIAEADEMFGGAVDLSKYKEDTYGRMFLWTVLIFTGAGYRLDKRIMWAGLQALLVMLLGFGIFVVATSRFEPAFIFFAASLILLNTPLYLKRVRTEFRIDCRTVTISIFSGIALFALCFAIKYFSRIA